MSRRGSTNRLSRLGSGVERADAFLEEFILEFPALIVGLHRANRFTDRRDPGFHFVFAEFLIAERSVPRIVIAESRIPPDPGVHIFRQSDTLLVGSGFTRRAID